MPCPRKPVKQHNRCFYWLTRDAAVGLARLRPPGRVKEQSSILGDFIYRDCVVAVSLAPLRLAGPDFRCTKISARPGSDFIYTNVSGGRSTLAEISRKWFKKLGGRCDKK